MSIRKKRKAKWATKERKNRQKKDNLFERRRIGEAFGAAAKDWGHVGRRE